MPFLSLLTNSCSSFQTHLQCSLLQEALLNHASRDSPRPPLAELCPLSVWFSLPQAGEGESLGLGEEDLSWPLSVECCPGSLCHPYSSKPTPLRLLCCVLAVPCDPMNALPHPLLPPSGTSQSCSSIWTSPDPAELRGSCVQLSPPRLGTPQAGQGGPKIHQPAPCNELGIIPMHSFIPHTLIEHLLWA